MTNFRRIITFLVAAVLTLPVLAQQETTTAAATGTNTQAATTTTIIANVDSEETRAQLHEILNRLPPQVGKTIKLDPTLWTNSSYLANYPALAAFASTHPEVAHSPSYFFEGIWIPSDPTPETANFRIWNQVLESITIMVMVAMFSGIGIWLIKTLIEHRRWNRLSRTQAEVHNKLLDRFGNNEDLLAYINTNAGRRFLESAPLQLEETPRSIGAPVGRVLWSVQIGIVLTAAGLGMKFVGAGITEKEVSQSLSAVGILGIAVGIGFIVAAAASFVLSRRLGLLQLPKPEAAASE